MRTSPNLLEPISKLSEEDNEAGELDKAEEVLGVEFPADEYAAAIVSRRRNARRASVAYSGLAVADLASAA